ncbi:hypothetical protein [Polyangium mundeleinium]|uniref:Uncharacterized protein n=1 Tax=Polyangium mundeleinium TaxID=2995306 RepID=A0ABT5EP08_9BACT|nr:hypothetical protein [Polyangium mundeleinium]MDC0743582.1 hypothetical protein [Polyangium mundeleinium]
MTALRRVAPRAARRLWFLAMRTASLKSARRASVGLVGMLSGASVTACQTSCSASAVLTAGTRSRRNQCGSWAA